ncbi:hypothetical protein SAY86_030432 [Trapa natans]|uniref:Phytosulfokine n=1 Tax=Trapa natans TaxID=22666 RepID=A0AAN7RH49_TRANT|nr:hypothetical protein SAY86_030432 [Trapa natans]
MKQSHGLPMLQLQLLLLLLLLIPHSSSRLMKPITSEEDGGIHHAASSCEDPMTGLSELIGADEVNSGDQSHEEEDNQECFKRRMMAEAHLDYIYTQHHKP